MELQVYGTYAEASSDYDENILCEWINRQMDNSSPFQPTFSVGTLYGQYIGTDITIWVAANRKLTDAEMEGILLHTVPEFEADAGFVEEEEA